MRDYFRRHYWMGHKHFTAFCGIYNRIFDISTDVEVIYMPTKKELKEEWEKQLNEKVEVKNKAARNRDMVKALGDEEVTKEYDSILKQCMLDVMEIYKNKP